MKAAVTNWGFGASWFGKGDIDTNWTSGTGFSVEFTGPELDFFAASGAYEGDFEAEGNVGTMALGFPKVIGSGITPGLQNFGVEVEGNLGVLVGKNLFSVDVEVGDSLGVSIIKDSFAVTYNVDDDAGALVSINSHFGSMNIGGDVGIIVDRGGLMNSYSADAVEVARFIGGGFSFLATNELGRSLLVRDSISTTAYVGQTDGRTTVRLEGGENNYVEVANAGAGLTINTTDGQGNVVRVGNGAATFNIELTEAPTTYSQNITALGGTGDDIFNVNDGKDVDDGKDGGVADIEGGDGSDVVTANLSNGVVHFNGGQGADAFIFMGGVGHFEDFQVGIDKIQVDSDEPVTFSMYMNDDGLTMTVWMSDQGLIG